MTIDLNADVGEGCDDRSLMPFLTSANIACGGHAGDDQTMSAVVAEALRLGISLGAHPSYVDREGFGRRDVEVSRRSLEEAIRSQIHALASIAARRGARLTHVKPHGALYNRAARDADVARAVARAVADVDRSLYLVGLAGSALLVAAAEERIKSAAEAFADRGYAPDGSLLDRGLRGALIRDPAVAAAQAVSIARDGEVLASDGSRIRLHADTICLHGDTERAVDFARAIRDSLASAGIAVAAFR